MQAFPPLGSHLPNLQTKATQVACIRRFLSLDTTWVHATISMSLQLCSSWAVAPFYSRKIMLANCFTAHIWVPNLVTVVLPLFIARLRTGFWRN